MGPLVQPKKLGLELGATRAMVSSSERRRDEGAVGNVIARVAERARLAGRVASGVELGVEAEHMPVRLAQGVARDAHHRDLDGDHVWRFGPALRLRHEDIISYGLTAELAGGALPNARTNIRTGVYTDYSTDPPTVTARGPTSTEQPPDSIFYLQARAGFEGGLRLGRGVELGAGAMLENLPVYDHAEWETYCTSYYAGGTECGGDTAPDSIAHDAWLLIPYLALAVEAEPFTLLAQAFGVLGDARLAPHVPLGGQLSLRVAFDVSLAAASPDGDPYREALP